MPHIKKLTALLLCFSIGASASTKNLTVDPVKVKQEKKAFIQTLVMQYHFNPSRLNALFQTLHPNQEVIHCMTKPFEKKPWGYYRNFFLTPERIQLGAQYMKTHHVELMQLQKKYGIPPSIITAIIGVETEYGLHLGKYSVLSALYTLGFYYPPREKFFRKELMQYFILARDNHLNLQKTKGSYAGALGIPQFMPSSYRRFGVAYHPGAPVNLFKNEDAIASVANYFHKNGWAPNQPIAKQLSDKNDKLDAGTKRYQLRVKDGIQHWEMYHNFYTIMTYNHNVVYAMAVYELSQAIQKASCKT